MSEPEKIGRIVIVTGPPGAGKSTIARIMAENAEGELGVHLHTDDFYAYIRKGYIMPWLPESAAQNRTVIAAQAAAASIYARGGYDVFADGIIGPWFLETWKLALKGSDLHYIVLLPAEEATVARAIARQGHPMRDAEVVKQMHAAFAEYGDYSKHWLDTSRQSEEETCNAVMAGLKEGKFQLS